MTCFGRLLMRFGKTGLPDRIVIAAFLAAAVNYHENASNAFAVASQIADKIKAIPGEKVIMAHSLGNMVVSSMIQDHGLEVSKYIMCNSAVPAEAYDETLAHTNSIPLLVRAAHLTQGITARTPASGAISWGTIDNFLTNHRLSEFMV